MSKDSKVLQARNLKMLVQKPIFLDKDKET